MHDSAEDDDSDNLTSVTKSPVPRPKSSSKNTRRYSQAKTIQQEANLYSPRNDSSGDSDNEVRSLSSNNGSDSSDENDSESDNDNRKAERTNKAEDSRADKNKRKHSRAAEIKVKKKTEKTNLAKSKDSSDESNDSNSSSENESDTDNDENIDDNVNKQSKQVVNNNESKRKTTTETDSETDEDESDHDQHVSNDLVLINEELETLAKEMATPGMPAVDLLESHEKLINQVNHVKKRDTKKKINHTNHGEDDDETVGDDIDDLIDTIDDLIDADDEDITYANKQELKKKSFKNKVGLVISTNKLAKWSCLLLLAELFKSIVRKGFSNLLKDASNVYLRPLLCVQCMSRCESDLKPISKQCKEEL